MKYACEDCGKELGLGEFNAVPTGELYCHECFSKFLPDTISISWSVEDVRETAKDLTDWECKRVLQLLKSEHDATIGINWNTIEAWADHVREERK